MKLCHKICRLPNKPHYATLEEWDTWHETSRKAHPVKYFLFETLPNKFGKITKQIVDTPRDLVYRLRAEHDIMRSTTLRNTDYRDFGDKFPIFVLDGLVEYIEVDVASRVMDSKFSAGETGIRFIRDIWIPDAIENGRHVEATHYENTIAAYEWWVKNRVKVLSWDQDDLDGDSFGECMDKHLANIIAARGLLW